MNLLVILNTARVTETSMYVHTTIIESVDYVNTSLDSKLSNIAVYLDFSKELHRQIKTYMK